MGIKAIHIIYPMVFKLRMRLAVRKKSKEINNEIEKMIMENTLWGDVHEEWLCIGENSVPPPIDEPMCDFTLKALWREV